MSDRRRFCPHHQEQQHTRQVFDDKCRVLADELRKKNDTIDALRNEFVLSNQSNDLSRSTCVPTEQSFVRNTSQRSSVTSNWNALTKDRELAKMKALVFQKDNELIALTTTNKNALTQMEERMERERKVWNEHRDLLLAGERAKFEEEKTRLLKDLQDQLKLEQERCQRVEQKLYDAQMQSSEAQLLLKESGRERINAVYSTKEQCRKEFQDEITRLRNQFQLEKDAEFTRIQQRIHELENELDRLSTENSDATMHQQELFISLETSEKTCIRSINDCIKKLHMAMDSPSHVYSKIPQITSFTYDRQSVVERVPTRSVLKLLQDTIDDIRNYIVEQKVQIEAKTKILNKSKVLSDRTTDYSNETYGENNHRNHQLSAKSSFSKTQKENDYYFRDIDRLSQPYDNDHHHHRSQNSSSAPFQLSSEQTDTIDNLVQKLEDHIASELDRLTKQRLTLNGTNHHAERSTSFRLESPKKVKFEPLTVNTGGEANQDSLIRHLQDRVSDLQDDNTRLRDNQQSKTTYQENDNHHSLSSMRLHNYSTTQ